MKFQFLLDNKTENSKCMAEWGLSVLIETAGKKILLDTGLTDLYLANAEALGVDLTDVDAKVGDEAILLGTDGVNTITAQELMRYGESVSGEVTAAISPRVKRVYE